ncbi:TSUP family transporter [Vibrio tubiashii]|uniref:Probable membrane transporter protein n=1 Tax=Vibrio tubiashii ATCC 19109 TaxID=1051646 RepID=F9TDQ9_9VIBR|nr:TSUP family transporter [Vibrio tubiashii]AIW14599.1 membrane protein [Vibrio tubiashii ATCC 19109]EGU46708.1 membrane protein [Vibrio tubiashii ATCC 19109]EIF02399.1 membrane protein [Vibrio tubiashii NCIMB 1337 = ATCC 19106]MCG9575741.1 TSUP family transporter [Vibrio tubiashii]
MEWLGNDITLWVLIALMISAFAAGFIDSVAGGGGLILVPSFILAGLPPQIALGQEKIVSTLGTIAAIRNFMRNKCVVWTAVATGIPAGLAGAYFGAEAILYFEPETIGKIILGMLPIGIVLSFIPKKNNASSEEKPINKHVILFGVPSAVFVIGFYDGFFGPGTGSFLILALHYLLRFDLVSASATSKLFNFASNIGALIAFMLAGNVLYALALPLVAMNLLGNHFGSASAMKYGAKLIQRTISLSLTLLMCSLGYKFLVA